MNAIVQTSTPQVVANSNPAIDRKEFTFRFKKDKLGNKRANVKCENVPVVSAEGVIEILRAGGKELEVLLEVVSDYTRSILAEFVSDEVFNQDTFEYDKKLAWKTIANMPKEDRRSSAIDKEIWEGFTSDYIEIMPALTGKTKDQVTLATEVYVKKLVPLKSDKKTLAKLKDQLTIYADSSKKAEDYQEVLELLTRRIQTYMEADDPAVLAANL